MAFCTRCGSKLDDGAIFCNNCFTPTGAASAQEPVQAQYDFNSRESAMSKTLVDDDDEFTELSKSVNRKELIWFIVTTILGILTGFLFFNNNMAGDTLIPGTVMTIGTLIMGLMMAGYYYSWHYVHPIRGYILQYGLFFGLIAILFVANILVCTVGIFFWYPRAWFRFILRKPLLNEEEIFELRVKGLID